MDHRDTLLKLEEQFWAAEADFYEEHLTEDALMVFPSPVGILDREAILGSLSGSPRWKDVELLDPRIVPLGEKAAVLAYRANASRGEGHPDFSAQIVSCYVMAGGEWRLAFHLQAAP